MIQLVGTFSVTTYYQPRTFTSLPMIAYAFSWRHLYPGSIWGLIFYYIVNLYPFIWFISPFGHPFIPNNSKHNSTTLNMYDMRQRSGKPLKSATTNAETWSESLAACPPVENVPAAKWVWSQSEGSPCRNRGWLTVRGLHVFIVMRADDSMGFYKLYSDFEHLLSAQVIYFKPPGVQSTVDHLLPMTPGRNQIHGVLLPGQWQKIQRYWDFLVLFVEWTGKKTASCVNLLILLRSARASPSKACIWNAIALIWTTLDWGTQQFENIFKTINNSFSIQTYPKCIQHMTLWERNVRRLTADSEWCNHAAILLSCWLR